MVTYPTMAMIGVLVDRHEDETLTISVFPITRKEVVDVVGKGTMTNEKFVWSECNLPIAIRRTVGDLVQEEELRRGKSDGTR